MKKVYVWGTGIILSRILDYRIKLNDIEAFIDNNPNKVEYLGKKVISPYCLQRDYDAIIVASMHTGETIKQCSELHFDMNKILFLYNNIVTKDVNQNYKLAEEILGREYADIVRNRYHLVRDISRYETVKIIDKDLYNVSLYKEDYVRVKTLELIAEEIRENEIYGAVAELGVYKGEFSRCINILFPDRKLYLFDTFDGFGKKEADYERKNGSCNEVFIDAFKNVNVNSIFKKMKYPENIEVKEGFFPATAEGLDEKFAFVSLDVDFEESTLNGINYFYPRLSEGGYLFIHDYNYGYFDCIRKALRRYENENDIKLRKVPVCDAIGTVVIVK